jgi:YcaO-like protein with predicted kinase domain
MVVHNALDRVLSGTTEKRFQRGQHRACSPSETLRRVQPRLARFGITRVGNVTGLDRLGIPVVLAVRPNARSLSISQGKGVDLEAARASGIMEALENHCAERPCLAVWSATYRRVKAQGPVVDPRRLRRTAPHCSTDAQLPWVQGHDLCADLPVWVPLERVHVDYTQARKPGAGLVLQDSNGLASGNTLGEAILQALLELIERDASAMAARQRAQGSPVRWVDPAQLGDPVLLDLLERCRLARVRVRVADATSDIGVPVFEAGIAEGIGGSPVRVPGVQTVWGAGCHLDPAIAMLRALTEAAQARLTFIVGSREDLTIGNYVDPFAAQETPPPDGVEPNVSTFVAAACTAQPTIEGDLALVLERLMARGIEEVIAVDLSPRDIPIFVVRMIVPDLEGIAWSHQYVPGPRALAVTR